MDKEEIQRTCNEDDSWDPFRVAGVLAMGGLTAILILYWEEGIAYPVPEDRILTRLTYLVVAGLMVMDGYVKLFRTKREAPLESVYRNLYYAMIVTGGSFLLVYSANFLYHLIT
jgi:hypothetical protein